MSKKSSVKKDAMRKVGIFEDEYDGFYWMDYLDKCDMSKAKFYLDYDNCAGVHTCVESAYESDRETDYSDSCDGMQNESALIDGETYVVTYWMVAEDEYGRYLDGVVDFGLTKQEIIENVNVHKYAEGAVYYTMGQMFYTTKQCLCS